MGKISLCDDRARGLGLDQAATLRRVRTSPRVAHRRSGAERNTRRLLHVLARDARGPAVAQRVVGSLSTARPERFDWREALTRRRPLATGRPGAGAGAPTNSVRPPATACRAKASPPACAVSAKPSASRDCSKRWASAPQFTRPASRRGGGSRRASSAGVLGLIVAGRVVFYSGAVSGCAERRRPEIERVGL